MLKNSIHGKSYQESQNIKFDLFVYKELCQQFNIS